MIANWVEKTIADRWNHALVRIGRSMEIPSGGFLRQWRKTLGLTQSQLAEESGLTQSVIAKVERESVDPRASTLRKMVAALLRSESPDQAHTVGDIMVEEVAVLAPEDTVQSAIERMVREGISQLPVISASGAIIGLVSESSLLGANVMREAPVQSVMQMNFEVVNLGVSIAEGRRLLVEREVLLITDAGVLCGLVSRIDMVRALSKSEGELH
ncbi:CBS domain-containing protein [Euryarchaeota archaeon]|nr:CBS domain-containing protein [Euryarchaeota archaeon]